MYWADANSPGFVIFYEENNNIYVVDIIYQFGSTFSLSTLLSGFERYCASEGKYAIIVCMIGGREIQDVLKSFWYKEFPPHPTKSLWMATNDNFPKTQLLDAAAWFLGDEDAN